MIRLLLLLSILFSINVYSQIIIDNTAPYNTATYLIDNVLLGGGIVGSNHSFIGDPNQIGFFDGINSNIGIDSGIVLSTGDIYDIVGPNNSGGMGGAAWVLPGDVTLDAVIFPDPTNDAAVLEFDFVPTSDTLSFKYVFASEEYLEFVNSFNDAFGFFLSGPNPAGGNYVDKNLAIIPGTANTPVTIDNLNDATNSAYYIDNGTGVDNGFWPFSSYDPQYTDPTVIQFDGFTIPLTAFSAVNCGDTYHIKLVVADAVDYAWDSGIFLEAGSFFSPLLDVTDNLSIDSNIMSIPCNGDIILTANSGVGATYQWFDSTSTVFSTNASVTISEGVYVVSADISGCAIISDTLRIIEGDSPTFNLGVDFMIPCNADTLIDPLVSGGTAPYSYLWNSGDTDSMTILSSGVYSVIVTDFYGCSDADTLEIFSDLPPSIELGVDLMIPCNSDTLINPLVAGGTAPFSYLWNSGDTDSMTILSSGVYSVVVTDFDGCSNADTLEITYDASPSIELGVDLMIPCNADILIDPLVAGGTAPYSYLWNSGDTDSMIILSSGVYSVVVTDFYGCSAADTLEITYDASPSIELGIDLMIPCNSDILIDPLVSGGAAPYSYLWNSGDTDSMTILSSGVYSVVVTDFYGCSDADTLEITYDDSPSIELGVDLMIPCNADILIDPLVAGGTAPYSYLWNSGDTDSMIILSSGVYSVIVTDFYGCSDADTINITEDAPGTVTVIGGEQICYGESTMIMFDFNGLLPWELVFSDGNINRSIPLINSSNFIHATSEDGLYSVVEAKDINGCVAANIGSAEIIVHPLPIPIIYPSEVVIYEGEQMELSVGTYFYYEWYSEENFLLDTLSTLMVSDSGSVYVWVMNANGCAGISAPVVVHIDPLTQLFIPSVFTPNNDEHNELFVIKGEYIESFNIKIFSSWGEQLFESNQIDKYWDGTFKNKKVQQDTYYYNIEVVGKDGNLLVRSGNVKVIY